MDANKVYNSKSLMQYLDYCTDNLNLNESQRLELHLKISNLAISLIDIKTKALSVDFDLHKKPSNQKKWYQFWK